MNHETSAFHHLALYFGQSDRALVIWIIAIAVVVIAAVGFAVVQVSAGMPEDER